MPEPPVVFPKTLGASNLTKVFCERSKTSMVPGRIEQPNFPLILERASS